MHLMFTRPAAALAALLLVSPAFAETPRKIEKTAVCANAACTKGAAAYRPWELKLKVPAKLGRCTTYRTTPFLAVVLTRDVPDTAEDDCDDLPKGRDAKAIEALRQQAVPAFRGRAVFARTLCTGYGSYVQYDAEGETSPLRNFVAVYAGGDRAAAERLLTTAKRRYPKAEIASMTAYIDTGDESCK